MFSEIPYNELIVRNLSRIKIIIPNRDKSCLRQEKTLVPTCILTKIAKLHRVFNGHFSSTFNISVDFLSYKIPSAKSSFLSYRVFLIHQKVFEG